MDVIYAWSKGASFGQVGAPSRALLCAAVAASAAAAVASAAVAVASQLACLANNSLLSSCMLLHSFCCAQICGMTEIMEGSIIR